MAASVFTGIDIGSFSIKAVVLDLGGKQPKLIALGTTPCPQPGMVSDSDIDLDSVAQSIKHLLASIKAPTSNVVASLPESKIFTRVVSDFPFLNDEELASSIKYSTEEFVPLPSDQVNLYWQVIERSKQTNKTSVFVVASPKSSINKYLKVFEKAEITPLAIETDLVACARSLIGYNLTAPTTLIVQMGASSTDFAVVAKGILHITRSVATGGHALTRAVSQYLSFEFLQAEEYKKVYGLLENQLEGKILNALKPLVDIIISEARRVIQAYQTKNLQDSIKRIVISGDGAKMPGLVIYFANNIGIEVQEADPWLSIEKDPALAGKLLKDAPGFSIAAGLALRGE